MQMKRIIILVVFGFIGMQQSAQSAELPRRFGVSLKAGAGQYFTNYGTQFTVGGDFTYRLSEPFEVGLGYLTSHLSEVRTSTILGNTLAIERIHFVFFKGDFRPVASAREFWVGARAGLSILASSTGLVNSSLSTSYATHFLLGAAAGYDYAIHPQVVLGGEINTLYAFRPNRMTLLNALLSVKYLF